MTPFRSTRPAGSAKPGKRSEAAGPSEPTDDSSLLDTATGRGSSAAGEEETVKFVDRRPWASRTEAPEEGAAVSSREETGAPRYPSFVEELKARTEAAERTAADVQERYRQAEAGMDETRRKLAQDVSRRVENELARLGRDLISGLLPVLDDLERALRTSGSSAADDSFVAGIELVRKNFIAALQAQGVERIETAGLPYDPETAEAVQAVQIPTPEQDGIVLEDLEPAYRFRGQMFRPARVTVGRFTPKS